MSDMVLVAIITAIASLTGSFLANLSGTSILKERLQNLQDDVSTLSARVDKHNNLVERMAKVEASTKSAHKRIDDFSKNVQ